LDPLVLDAAQQDSVIELVGEAASGAGCHGAIITDFGQGFFTPALLARACSACRKSIAVLAGDVSGRRSNLRAMHSMDLLCPSEAELRESYGGAGGFDRGLPTVT